MCGVRGEDEVVFYAERPDSGIRGISEPDLEKAFGRGRGGGLRGGGDSVDS